MLFCKALDTVNEMFGHVQNRDPLNQSSSPELLEAGIHHLAILHIAKMEPSPSFNQ